MKHGQNEVKHGISPLSVQEVLPAPKIPEMLQKRACTRLCTLGSRERALLKGCKIGRKQDRGASQRYQQSCVNGPHVGKGISEAEHQD